MAVMKLAVIICGVHTHTHTHQNHRCCLSASGWRIINPIEFECFTAYSHIFLNTSLSPLSDGGWCVAHSTFSHTSKRRLAAAAAAAGALLVLSAGASTAHEECHKNRGFGFTAVATRVRYATSAEPSQTGGMRPASIKTSHWHNARRRVVVVGGMNYGWVGTDAAFDFFRNEDILYN